MQKSLPTKNVNTKPQFQKPEIKIHGSSRSIPKGWGFATLDEVAARYTEDASLREQLVSDPELGESAIAVNQVGEVRSGPHQITADGKFVEVGIEPFIGLEPQNRAWFYPGDLAVQLRVELDDQNGVRKWLNVYAGDFSWGQEKIAIVKITKPALRK